jgi:hypothetical protein
MMNIEEYLNNAENPVSIVSDLIEDFCIEYEEEPLSVAHENNSKKIQELDYLEPDDLLIDMLQSADLYIYNTYKEREKYADR